MERDESQLRFWYICYTDQLQTWTVLKWSNRFKMGQTILEQAGQTIQTISKGIKPFLKESDH